MQSSFCYVELHTYEQKLIKFINVCGLSRYRCGFHCIYGADREGYVGKRRRPQNIIRLIPSKLMKTIIYL